MTHPAVFLDRDGAINEEMGYINHISRLVLLPHSIAGIRRLNQAGIKVVVITNQSGAARGYFPESLIDHVNAHMERLLAAGGAKLDGIYTCTHSPEAGCACRKPRTGLLEQAAQELNLDWGHSYLVGDRYRDVETAANAGIKGILVLTGYGRGELEYLGPAQKVQPIYVAADLLDAAEWILADLKR